jgi:hypothetical protein
MISWGRGKCIHFYNLWVCWFTNYSNKLQNNSAHKIFTGILMRNLCNITVTVDYFIKKYYNI